MHTVSVGITLFSCLFIYQSLILISGSVFGMSLDFKPQYELMYIHKLSININIRGKVKISSTRDVMLWWGLSCNDSSQGLPPCYKMDSSVPSSWWSISVNYLRYLCSLHWDILLISFHSTCSLFFLLFRDYKNWHLRELTILIQRLETCSFSFRFTHMCYKLVISCIIIRESVTFTSFHTQHWQDTCLFDNTCRLLKRDAVLCGVIHVK